MKTRAIITITTILIAVAISTVFLIYNWRQNKVEQWNEEACVTFKKALEEDLHSRSDIKVQYHESPRKEVSLNTKIPKSVLLISEFGKREYKIDSCKHVHNILSGSHMRMIAGIVLDERPLVPDVMNTIWQRLLVERQIVGQTGVRISVTDLEEHTTSKSSTSLASLAACDSLLSCYIGYRCEVEVTGFIKYAWLRNITFMDGLFFSLPLFITALLCFVRFVFKDKLSTCLIKEVPVFIEKEISVIAIDKCESRIYQVGEGAYFDFGKSLLKTDKGEAHLYPQSKLLLLAFLEAKDYCLSLDEIMHLLWPKGDGTLDKIHQAITRLRGSLIKVSQITLINENCTYQLKISHSIDENSNS